jgi:ATP-dependent Clp protease ATP-binding subunit ClpC
LAVVLADREARALGHPLVDTEHLLLGVIEADRVLAGTLGGAGVSAPAVRAQLISLRGADSPLGRGDTVFTDALQAVLRGAGMFARRKDRPVTCSDLIVELLNADMGDAWQILARLGADPATLRRLVAPAPNAAPAGASTMARVRRFVAPRD